jgi:hypothetical protein
LVHLSKANMTGGENTKCWGNIWAHQQRLLFGGDTLGVAFSRKIRNAGEV